MNANRNVDQTTQRYMAKYPTRFLKPGTLVVSNEDGEPGHVEQVCTLRRGGNTGAAQDYVVVTKYGREIWYADDLFVPETD